MSADRLQVTILKSMRVFQNPFSYTVRMVSEISLVHGIQQPTYTI